MTKEQIKQKIDLEITNKTATNSVTPIIVGDNMKDIVDLFPNLILSYEGSFDSTTIPQFSNGVMNVYRVTENFTYNTVVLKIGNIIGLISTTIILIADNQKELLQNQLDAITNSTNPSASNPFVTQNILSSYVKKVNSILPDGTGNVIIPDASQSFSGIVNNSTIEQIIYGKKTFKLSETGNLEAFSIKSNANADILKIWGNNGYINIGGSANPSYRFQVSGTGNAGTMAASNVVVTDSDFKVYSTGDAIDVGLIRKTAKKVYFSGSPSLGTGFSIDVNKLNFCVGSDTLTTSGTTNLSFEVKSKVKGSNPFPKMFYSERILISTPEDYETVIQTDTNGASIPGLYRYKASTGWVKID